jgi:hypothetical protein
MAISLVGIFEGQRVDTTELTVNLSGTQAGDVVYACHGYWAGGPAGTPSGYTAIGTATLLAQFHMRVSRKVLSGADTTVVFPAASANSANTAQAIVLRGVDNTTPEDATATTATSSSTSTQPDGASITTTTAGAWVISAVVKECVDAAVTAPSGYSNQSDIAGDATTADATTAVATKLITSPGAEDPGAWSNFANGTVTGWCAVTVAVRAFNPPIFTQNNINIIRQARMRGY